MHSLRWIFVFLQISRHNIYRKLRIVGIISANYTQNEAQMDFTIQLLIYYTVLGLLPLVFNSHTTLWGPIRMINKKPREKSL